MPKSGGTLTLDLPRIKAKEGKEFIAGILLIIVEIIDYCRDY